MTVNQAAKLDTYLLPRIEHLFASLNEGKIFTKLDLAYAYQQDPLDEESKNLVAIIITPIKASTDTTDCLLECPLHP